MPASYTHYYFARDVLKNLHNDEIVRIINKFPELYYIGCHGADINFFYKAYKSNAIVAQAYQIHFESGAVFFNHALEAIKKAPDREAAWAYLLGFLTHYILDSNCHPYINTTVESKTGEYHQTIESQYDRRFLLKDALDPMTTPIREHIVVSDFNAQVIAPFFDLNPENIRDSLKGFKFFDTFFVTKNPLRRKLTNFMLRRLGKDNLTGLFMIPGAEMAKLTPYLDHLDELYATALAEAPDILKNVYQNQELNERFERNFE